MKPSKERSDEPARRRRLLQFVIGAVAVWGSLLALGACLFGLDPVSGEVRFAPHPLRGLIVLGCVVLFVGGWSWLASRRPSA